MKTPSRKPFDDLAWLREFEILLFRLPGLGIERDVPAMTLQDAYGLYRWLFRKGTKIDS